MTYAENVAAQLGLNGDFVKQMDAIKGISNSDILSSAYTALKYGDFIDAKGNATGAASSSTSTTATESRFSSFMARFGMARFGANAAAIVIGLILIAASVWKLS